MGASPFCCSRRRAASAVLSPASSRGAFVLLLVRGHFLSLRFLFGEYLPGAEVDARSVRTNWRTPVHRRPRKEKGTDDICWHTGKERRAGRNEDRLGRVWREETEETARKEAERRRKRNARKKLKWNEQKRHTSCDDSSQKEERAGGRTTLIRMIVPRDFLPAFCPGCAISISIVILIHQPPTIDVPITRKTKGQKDETDVVEWQARPSSLIDDRPVALISTVKQIYAVFLTAIFFYRRFFYVAHVYRIIEITRWVVPTLVDYLSS